MKLFTAIASAAVIGASFLVPNPVEARNGWFYAGTANSGTSYYVKPLVCNGNLCNAIENGHGGNERMVADCGAWR